MRSPLWLALLAALSLAACQRRDPGEEAGARRTAGGEDAHAAPARRDLSGAIGEALRIALGDLDGDGAAEIVVVHADALRVLDRGGRERARAPAPGGVQVLEVSDIDGDGRAEILAGWGLTVERRDATARVSIHRLAGEAGGGERLVEELVATPEGSRHEIVAIRPLQGEGRRSGGLLVAHYTSTYMVRAVRARRGIAGGWAFDEIATIRMATSWTEGDLDGDGRPELVVGRVYGDDLEAEGEAFLLAPDGRRTPIPTRGGVRDLAPVDLDRDGRLELLVADGWHRSYAREGRGRLSWLRPGDGGRLRAELIDDGGGQYTVWEIAPADLDGDGRLEVVTRGSAVVEVRRRDAAGRWSRQTVAGEARDLATGDLDGRPGEEILVLGERAEVLSFPGAP